MPRCRACIIFCALLLPFASVSAQDVLTPAQAATKAGETVTLHMHVRAVGTSGGTFTDLLSEMNHQHPDAFIVRLTPDLKEKFKQMKIPDPGKHFLQKFIRVTGTVKILNYANIGKRPAIDVSEISQIEIVEADALHPPGAEVLELYQSGKLFQRSAYKEARGAFSRRFEANHQADLKKAYGDDYDAINAWFAKNPDVQENFYTALVERYDDIPKALALFKEIWKRHPDTMPKWSQLAIATAVTWDQERGVYDYKPHQNRVQSVLPDGMLGALENYRYVVDNEKRMPQPVSLYPWEFLIFVVNHRTPMPERNWAFNFFQVAKVKSKSWHKEVPYDFEIVKREIDKDPAAEKPKLAGKEYSLANIKTYGGVCAHQADFACRTAQSLGIPAVYCAGSSAYRDNHAWWMFINVSSATKDEIKFVLQSDGRFDGKDNFYTGQVLDPQSGRIMLDRDMERRLWLAGTDRLGKRLSSLIMRVYPSIAIANKFDTKEKVAYLEKCLKVSKYNEDAWLNFAQLAKRGDLNDDNKKIALAQLASLNQTFAVYPDFIWRIFDDMIEVATPTEKIKQYENVLAQFEKAKRADLACDARLKLTEILVEQSKNTPALAGLANSVRKFPTEGRYVPKMLKKMEEVAPSVKEGPTQVAQVYVELIPKMIIYYGNDTNIYYKKMNEQAKAFFEQNNLTQATKTLEARVNVAKAGLKSKKT
jgi:hypothetical protein